jgi:O-antigen/teichoic acid export membrane protein
MDDYLNNFLQKITKQKDLASIGFSNIVGGAISGIFWLYLASMINPESYGEIHYFIGIAGLAQIVSLIGTTDTLTVYTAKNVKIQSTLFFISIIAAAISALAITIIFYRFDAALLALGYVIFELLNGVLLGKKLFVKYSKFFLIQKILTLTLGLGLYYTLGVDGIILAIALSFIPYFVLFISEFRETKIDFSLLLPRKGFIVNNYVMSIIGGSGSQIDKLIIAPLLGFALLGNYSLALQIITVMLMISAIVYKYLLPQDASGKSNKTLKKATVLISIGISILGILLSPVVIPELFPKYVEAIDAIQIMSIAVVPGTITLLYTSKLLGSEKSRFVLISKAISLPMFVTGFIILGPIFGIIGLASVFVFTVTFEASFLFSISKIKKL